MLHSYLYMYLSEIGGCNCEGGAEIERVGLVHFSSSLGLCSGFSLLARCSFDLARMMNLSLQVEGFESKPAVRQEELLKTEIRFAKGCVCVCSMISIHYLNDFSYVLLWK